MSETLDAQPTLEAPVESDLEKERALDAEQPENGQEKVPASLEKIRSETSRALSNSMRLAESTFGQQTEAVIFMKLTSGYRRDVLKKAQLIIEDEGMFGDPMVLTDLLKVLDIKSKQAIAINASETSGDIAESSSVDAMADIKSDLAGLEAGVTTEDLQKAVLQAVQDLVFQQVFADVGQFKSVLEERTENATRAIEKVQELGIITDENDRAQKAKEIESDIVQFEQYDREMALFDSYTMQSIGLMNTILQNKDTVFVDQFELVLMQPIIEEYAEAQRRPTDAEDIPIGGKGDRMPSPKYLLQERETILGTLTTEKNFSAPTEKLKIALQRLQTAGTPGEIQEAQAEAVDAAQQVAAVSPGDKEAAVPPVAIVPQEHQLSAPEENVNDGVSDMAA